MMRNCSGGMAECNRQGRTDNGVIHDVDRRLRTGGAWQNAGYYCGDWSVASPHGTTDMSHHARQPTSHSREDTWALSRSVRRPALD